MNQLDLGWRDVFAKRARAAAVSEAFAAAIRGRGTLRDSAHELDQIFGPEGRGVSESVLKAALSPQAERNYPRLEWLVLVLDEPAVQSVLRTPTLTPEEEVRVTREWLLANAPGLLPGLNRVLGRSL